MKRLFDENTGAKIRYTAIVLFIVGSLITIIIGIANIANYLAIANEIAKNSAKVLLWIGLAFLFAGPFIFWIVSLALYGLGVVLGIQINSNNLAHRFMREYLNKK